MTKPPNISARNWLNKVPEVTALFWIIKMIFTTVGKTAADFLSAKRTAV